MSKMKVMSLSQQQLQSREKEELSINKRESSTLLRVILVLCILTILRVILPFLNSMSSLLKCKMNKKENFKKVSKLWEACKHSKNQSMTNSEKDKMISNSSKESKCKAINNNKITSINSKMLAIKISYKKRKKSNNLKDKPNKFNWSIHTMRMEMFIEKTIFNL